MDHVALHELTSAAELVACEAIEQRVWGIGERELVPVSHLIAAVHAGGLVVGAVLQERLLGFAYGFPAYHPERADPLGFHSHMLAVLPEARGRGLGRRLKAFQREWCLARSLPWMSWTFDPLQARNARLNLEHLRASITAYRVDEYGSMGGSLNEGLPSDRLLAHWQLDSEPVRAALAGNKATPPDVADAPLLLRVDARGQLERGARKPGEAERVRVAVPERLTDLLRENPALALEWRLAVREVLLELLAAGWAIQRFVGGAYLLERPSASHQQM